MRNTRNENLCEHSFEVSMIAHALAVMSNTRFGTNYNAEKLAVMGLYHDCSEIITGDLPTPIKYYNKSISGAYKEIETASVNKILKMLPEDIKTEYEKYFFEDQNEKELLKLLKASDKISALIKCVEEKRMGNNEFEKAETAILEYLMKMDEPVVNEFLKEFMPSFSLTIDEL